MTNSYWEFKKFETNKHESHFSILRNLEMENYLKQFLKKRGFNLYYFKFTLSDAKIGIFLTIYEKPRKKKNKKNMHNENTNKRITKAEYLRKKAEYIRKKKWLRRRWLLKQKPRMTKTRYLQKKKWVILIKNLKQFTSNKFDITLKIKWVVKKFLKKTVKKAISKTNFWFKFHEMKKLYLVLATQKNGAELLGTFITKELRITKRHNYFLSFLTQTLNFIMRQKNSKIKGIKILLKGRLNNAPRSRSRIIKIGKIPLLSRSYRKNYSETTSLTSNGTIGAKIWINYTY